MVATGSHLGPYEILAPLGSGGMGEVYRARDPRLGREVAIKVLPERLAKDPVALARFEREVRVVAGLTHPNILVLHDFGTQQDRCYAVMELLEGATLRTELQRGPMPWPRAVEMGVAIADGLAAAHAKGIIHRDLKPENLFITRDGRIKILDFGLARIEQPATTPTTQQAHVDTAGYEPARTDPGIVLGTVGYMAPEQVRSLSADARSDIFALGCVLYEMLTSRRAFIHPTSAETLAAILYKQPKELTNLRKQAPAALLRALARCLEKEPEERFQSARDVSLALRDVLKGSASSSTPARTKKTLASLAVLPFANASADSNAEYLSDGITESIINILSEAPRLRVMARSTVFRYKGQAIDPVQVGKALNVKAVLTGRLVQSGDMVSIQAELVSANDGAQLWGEQYRRRLADLLVLQEEIAKEIAGKLKVRLTAERKKRLAKRSTDNAKAYQLYLMGRYQSMKATQDGLRRAIEFFNEAIALDPTYGLAHAGMAEAYYAGSSLHLSPHEAMPKALAAVDRALALDDTLAEAYMARGLIRLFYERNWSAAEADFQRAIALSPNAPTVHQYYAWHHVAMGQLEDAARELRRALELDPMSHDNNCSLAIVHLLAGRCDEAIQLSRGVIEMDPLYWYAYRYLGYALSMKGDHDAAISCFHKARQLDDSPELPIGLGHAYALAGKRDEAQIVLAELQALAGNRYVSAYGMALICVGLGDSDQALKFLEQANEYRCEWIIWMQVDPRLAPLRADPRFAELAKRIGLLKSSTPTVML